jgi:hypothetical protein
MLNGSLDTIALPDVLRLIATSGKSGLLRIEDASPSGRIFIVDGRVAFATTRNHDDPIDDLLHMEYRADYVGSADDRRIVDLTELLESNPEAFHRFLEQMVVEVLSRLLRVDEGRFRFDVDVRSRWEIPHSFDVEEMINQAEVRAEAWIRIFEVVPSATEPFRMAPRLDKMEEIALGPRDWALLAVTGASTTIKDISQELKIFEFAAAKKVAELAQRGLIEFIQTEVSETSVAAAELLSEMGDVVEVVGVVESPPQADPEEITFQEPPAAEPIAGGEVPEAEGPNWLPVDGDKLDDDSVPLLEELHRLHEAEAIAAEAGGAESEDEASGDETPHDETPDVDTQESDAEDDEDADIDELNGGDLATRWKNLRKAKRGVHAANE